MPLPEKTVYDNGLRVLTEKIPHARTVSAGVWVDVGARDEHDLNNGCSHFVEHMLFKGTPTRSAGRIARELDVLGGMANAFTSKDATCFYGTVLDKQLPRLIEIFADIFLHSLFAAEEIRRERQVIAQEIYMVEDTPEEQIHDLFEGLLWGHHPLGNTVLGSLEVVGHMDSQKLQDHVKRYYTPDRIVIAAAGNVDHDAFCELLTPFVTLPPVQVPGRERHSPHPVSRVQRVFTKPLEQVHVTLGTYGLPVVSEERYKLMLLNILLGGNMSSRLFQEIREKRGLAYSVHSYLDSYIDGGYLSIYMGVHPTSLNEALGVVHDEVSRMRTEPVSAAELANALDFARAGLYLAAENLEARMTRLARNELYFNRHVSFKEVIAGLEQVVSADIAALADRFFLEGVTAVILGPVKETAVDFSALEYGRKGE